MVTTGLLRFLVTVALTGCAYGNYFITCPNTFRPEMQFDVEAAYIGSETISVQASLGIEGQAPLDLRTSPISNGRTQITLNIPQIVPVGTYMLTVIGYAQTGEVFRNSSVIQQETLSGLLFIQTDKPMYKPSQTVEIRLVNVDEDLKPRNERTDISIFDQNNNLLQQWLAQESDAGVIKKSFKLADRPPLGTWRIQAKNQFAETSKEFEVQKYVLPKFEVTAESIPTFLIEGETTEFSIKVTAKYTYGKPVFGKALFIFGTGRNMKMHSVSLQGNEDGSHTQTFNLRDFQGIYNTYSGLKFMVNVTEGPTLVTESSDEVTIQVHRQSLKAEFLPSSSQVFRPGMPITLHLKVTNIIDNSPAGAGTLVNITAGIGNTPMRSLRLYENGMIVTSYDVPDNYTNDYGITFNANLKIGSKYLYASHTVKPYRTKLNTMITVDLLKSSADQVIRSDGSFSIEIKTTRQLAQVVYMVLARGTVVASDRVAMTALSKVLTIQAERKMSPQAYVVVYAIVTDGEMSEVIADAVNVPVTGLFENQVSLEFSEQQGRTGSLVDVTVRASPLSKYYLLVVDKSVLLLGTGNDITKGEVRSAMQKFSLGETPNYSGDAKPPMLRGDVIFPPFGGSTNDAPTSAGQIFKDRGLVFLSGMIVEEKAAEDRRFFELMPVAAMADSAEANGPVAAPSEDSSAKTEFAEVGRVRKSFPEAWLFMEGMVNANSEVTFTETIPDTITEWVGTCFAISPNTGLGITDQAAKLTAFNPFFVSLTLPYAIKRGEIFQLRATIFNYIEEVPSTQVKVTLKKSNDFGVVEKDANGDMNVVSKDVVTEIEVQRNRPQSVIFEISARKLGNIKLNVIAQPAASTGEKGDNLERFVLVKPEGIVQRKVDGATIVLDNTNSSFMKTIPIVLPEKIVPDSLKIDIRVTGDVMGPAISGLEDLLQVPYGCGEQNIITMSPNAVVIKYLASVNRVNKEVKDTGTTNMEIGYQREMDYKLRDGSFSAFGERDGNGSTWLTAFVIKSFSQAKNYITIDPDVIKKAATFLEGKQGAMGNFREDGRVIHVEMLGGGSAGKGLAAFVLIALKESESFLSFSVDGVVTKAKTYLEGFVDANQLNHTFDMAIIAYALTLAGSPKATILLEKLEGRAPWLNPQGENSDTGDEERPMPYYKREPTAGDIEIWAYVLLAYTKRGNIALGRPYMKWLIDQQNENGGFRSTQDTVLGLQALAEYAALAYANPPTDITLVAKSNTETHTFDIRGENTFVLQTATFSSETRSIELSANGRGLCVAKVAWQFNVMEDQKKKTDTREIESKIETGKINNNLFRLSSCYRSGQNQGMVVTDLELQTGTFVTNMDELRENKIVKRADEENGHVFVYFDQEMPDFGCVDVNLQIDLPVMNLQNATVKTYQYYEPEVQNTLQYTIAGEQRVLNICEVCKGTACPDSCPVPDPCKDCGNDCPKECDTSGASTWRLDAMLLSSVICLLLSLIMVI